MKFTKMHGAGNDFIIIDNRSGKISESEYSKLALTLCKRKTGIGADGLMIVENPRSGGDYAMVFFNDDGTKGEMCGNGARCIARYGRDNDLAGEIQRIETTAGLVTGEHIDGEFYKIRLNNPSVITLDLPIKVQGREVICHYTELGNPGIPHAVVVVDSLEDKNFLREFAREIRHHKAFPKGANVNLVMIKSENGADILTFERGVEDFTLACGTGSGATAALLSLKNLLSGKKILLNNPGGILTVDLVMRDNNVSDIYLSGPTCLVAVGETNLV